MSIQRIAQAFEKRQAGTALIPYIAAGDPDATTTLATLHGLVKAGADIIELGIPFSDPMADGKVIQEATERAIAGGMTLEGVFDLLVQFRQTNTTTPVVFMGYANSVEAMGYDRFCQRAQEAGLDGVLIVDYPPEEYGEFAQRLAQIDVAPIFLLAPTSTIERIKMVAHIAKGYVYYVSLKGVTGSGALDVDQVKERVQLIKQHVSIPVGVGFGIRDVHSAQAIGSVADAVVIGSQLIKEMQAAVQTQQDPAQAAEQWLLTIRHGLDTIKG